MQLEIKLITFDDLGWSSPAFPSVVLTLKHSQHLLAKQQMHLSQFADFVVQHSMSPVFDVQPMTHLSMTYLSTENPLKKPINPGLAKQIVR
jgi:hypothetical protein